MKRMLRRSACVEGVFRSSFSRSLAIAVALTWGGWADGGVAIAADASASFRPILEQHQKAALIAVAEYLEKHPDAADRDAAFEWLLSTATTEGWEAEVAHKLGRSIQQWPLIQERQQRALQVVALGWAKAGRGADAVQVLSSQLQTFRAQVNPTAIDFAHRLSVQVRMAGDFEASKNVYRQLIAAFPGSAAVKETAELKLAKLELVGKPAPRMVGADFQGRRCNWKEYEGKVVLVEFWSTNCAPCLAELPNLKAVYRDYQPKGLEIIGVSLDTSSLTVHDFAQKQGITWRQFLDNTIAEGTNRRQFSTLMIPSIFVIDQKGTIVQVDVKGTDLRKTVSRLLDGNK